MADFTGTPGNDTLTGTSSADSFNLIQGGEDTASGLGGDDVFAMGGTLDAGDQIDGGTGYDQIYLRGDYSGGVTFGATTVTNIDRIALGQGFDYRLTTNDATVAANATMIVDASLLSSANSLTFDGSAESDGHFRIIGGAGDDTITGGNDGDIFDMRQGGGADTINGGAGDDLVLGGANYNSGVTFNGGGGHNVLRLDGDYSSGLHLDAGSLTDVDTIQVNGGHSYDISADAALFASGQEIFVSGITLHATDSLTFDGTVEGVQDGARFVLTGGAGDDDLVGGRQGDRIDLSRGGNDTVSGENGNDIIELGGTLNAGDHIDGGAGNDTVALDGHTNVILDPTTIQNVETITAAAGFDYSITTDDGTVAQDGKLTVDASALGAGNSMVFNGAAETGGSFDLIGGAGRDHLTAGAGTDTLFGGLGGDTLTGGAGADVFVYTAVAESDGSANTDHVTDFNADVDKFQFPFVVPSVVAASVSLDNLGDLGVAINDGLSAHGAIVLRVISGLLSGETYLVVDANGDAAYTPGTDYVINITGAHNAIDFSPSNFTVPAG
jgi:Ca2+-binding RTX toxin-like protein